MKAQKMLAIMLYLVISVVICGCNEESNVGSVNAMESKREALGDGHSVIFEKNFGNGYHLTVLSPGITDLNKRAKCIPKERRKNAWHINAVFNCDGVPEIEDPLLDVHLTFWERNGKPKYCFGVYATKGKHNKYGSGNVIFCTTNCRNGKLERFNDSYQAIKTAFFKLELLAVAAYGLSAAGCSHVIYFAAKEILKTFAPKLFNLIGFLSDLPPPVPPEFIEQLSPIECVNDVPAGTPLPHEFNPSLTVVARDSTGLHIIGNEADQYFFTQFYADPNPANLLAVWVQGNWNGFSMESTIPEGYIIILA